VIGAPPPPDLPPALPSLWRTFKLGARVEPRLLTASLGVSVAMMLPDALLALWLAALVDGIVADDVARIRFAAGGLAISIVASWWLGVVNDRVGRRFKDRVSIALQGHVAELQASIATVEHHERPEHLDRLAMLRDQVFTLDHLFQSLFMVIGWVIRLGITAALLASVHPSLVLLFVAAVPAVVVSFRRPAVEMAVDEAAISHRRLARHLFVAATTPGPAKELRTTGASSGMARRRREEWLAWYRPVAHARAATAIWAAIGWAVFGVSYVGAVAVTADVLDRSVGAVVLVVAAGIRLAMYIGGAAGEVGFLRGTWMGSAQRLTWLEDHAAASRERVGGDVPAVLRDGIRFESVSFRYPGTERDVLLDVDLHFPAGAVVAVVGENGAGKTTLVKLLARLYLPTSGRILVDGVDLATVSPEAWRERLAGAFQDFVRFEFAAQRSVGVGDLPALDDEPAARNAVSRAGADDLFAQLGEGLATQLGATWADGVDLSFGQWQKVALARGFMRPSPLLLVLDEPTAALDAETEHELFERFTGAARAASVDGGVTVLVSHRFSTVRMADLIVVLDGNRIAEVGTHQELMDRGAQYAELFTIQAGSYRR
jgi:ATP-binding cassette, subfamily B, bacterial